MASGPHSTDVCNDSDGLFTDYGTNLHNGRFIVKN